MGARVRSLRRERGLTLKALGAQARLSHPFLSQLERGLARPSVGSVERIAAALGVQVSELWTERTPTARPRLVRRADAREVGGSPGRLREIAPHGEPLAVHEWIGGSRRWPDTPMLVEGHAMVNVIRGAIDVEVDGAVYAVREGDTLLFDGRMPHRMRRAGGPATRALLVVVSA